MNPGLMLRAMRETAGVTLILGVAVFLFEAVLSYVMPTISTRLEMRLAQMPYFADIVKAMLGVESPSGLGEAMFWAIPWAHPVVLAVTWAHSIIVCTRVPAGEVDRGTVDVLLALPVSRVEVFVSEVAAWLGSGAALTTTALLGSLTGRSQLPESLRADPWRVAMAAGLLACLYVCVGGMAWLVSSASDRRGRAIGVALLIVLTSFLLNYLAQFWDPAKHVVWMSVLDYYRPYQVLSTGKFPWRDAAVLLGTGAATTAAAGIVFSRRDLTSV